MVRGISIHSTSASADSVSRHRCHRNPLGKAPSSVLQACGKIQPKGRVLWAAQQGPCSGLWAQVGPPGAAGAEPQLGGTLASPRWWVWQPPVGLLSLVQTRAEPAASRNPSQPSPLWLTAIPEHLVHAPALLRDGNHPPPPSLPPSPVQYQGPYQGARISTGHLK